MLRVETVNSNCVIRCMTNVYFFYRPLRQSVLDVEQNKVRKKADSHAEEDGQPCLQ